MTPQEHQLASAIRAWRESPVRMVRELFHVEPDAWQCAVLERFPHRPRQVMTAAKGPGKTAVLAWLCWNFLLTRVNARVVALSLTATTLADTLWTELAKWQGKSEILSRCFELTASRIQSRERPETWWASARAYPRMANPQEQANTLAGLHEDHVLVLLDEAGGMPRSVLATAEAVLSGGSDQHIVLAGNPTNADSALGHAVIHQRANWDVHEVTGDPDDQNRAPRIDLEWAQQQIEEWGRDNPWVLVNVFGRFPPSGLNTLITPDEVRDAQKRHTGAAQLESQYAGFPLIFGVDVARFGDDESVIFPRRSRLSYKPLRMRNLDSIQGASHVARMADEQRADSIQIDITGGWGGGWWDGLKALGYTQALGVQFGGKASDPKRYANKRAEMYWEACQWIKDGGLLYPIDEMVAGLSSLEYTYTRDGRIQLEEKNQVKARLGRSPDVEDALACTFAFPVYAQRRDVWGLPASLSGLVERSLHTHEYDPYDRYRRETERARD